MDLFNDLLLKVYRAAGELPVGEFQDAALGLVRERLRFNSAVWAQGQNLQKGVAVHSAHLYNEPLEMILDWQRINDRDLVVEKVTRNVGHAQNINARTLYPGREHSVMREFSSRYGHQNLLIIGLLLDYSESAAAGWLCIARTRTTSSPQRRSTRKEDRTRRSPETWGSLRRRSGIFCSTPIRSCTSATRPSSQASSCATTEPAPRASAWRPLPS